MPRKWLFPLVCAYLTLFGWAQDVPLTVEGRITGVVLNEAGQTSSDAQVCTVIWMRDDSERTRCSVKTDNEGRFTVEHLKPGTYHVFAINEAAYGNCLYTVYVRGNAYLAAGDGGAAATQFQRITNRRGLVGNCWTGAPARLGLARAYAMQRDKVKANAAYQDFLTLWKDADPDIPIYKLAKAEYAKSK